MNKKGSFDNINAGMIAFIGFMMVVLLSVILVGTVKETDIVCGGSLVGNVCYDCVDGFTFNNITACCADAGGTAHCENANASAPVEYTGAAYNATKTLQTSAMLPSQFSQIVVIVIIVAGILVVLATIGYHSIKKMKQ